MNDGANGGADQDGGDDLLTAAAGLSRTAGLGRPLRLVRLAGGANNRVYRMDTDSGPAVLKAYFHHPDDPRDRLRAEYGFADMAWRNGVRALPRPLAADYEQRLGLYAFISGRRFTADDVGATAVRAALAFLDAVNRPPVPPCALPPASEACFTLADHLATVDRRLARLTHLPDGESAATDAARRFVVHDAAPYWGRLADATRRKAQQAGLSLDAAAPSDERLVSPSDFGFHNALMDAEGNIYFIDFEYAGWDDPAKLAGDFFHQPAAPVPRACYPDFRDALAARFPRPEQTAFRCDLLLPVYAVKWVAIMLNDFLPAGAGRRRFAGGPDAAARLTGQLDKARAALKELKDMAG